MKKTKICVYFCISIFITILLTPNNFYKYGNGEFNNNNKNVETAKPMTIKTSIVLPKELWNVSWTGPTSEAYGSDIDLDSKNNIYTTGQFGLFPNSNITINKTNNLGDPLWSKQIEASKHMDGGNGIVCDDLDNVYVTGIINRSSPTGEDVFIVKYNESGDLEWFETWGGSGNEEGQDITIDSEGNVYVVGSTTSYGVENSSLLILKYNNTGDFKWNETWDTTNYESGNKIDYDILSNHLYIAGTQTIGIFPNYASNAVILKYNTSLDRKWVNYLDFGLNESGNGIKVDLSGNITITGKIDDNLQDIEDVFLAKYNSSGNQLWNLTWNIWAEYFDGHDIDIDSANNIYVVGIIDTLGFDVWLGIHSTNGTKLYNMTWGTISNDEGGNGIVLDSSNYIYITGESYFAINFANQFILKLTPFNKSIVESTIPPGNNGNDDDDDDSGNNFAIPGYDLFIMIFLLSIIVIVVIKKKLRKSN